MNLSQLGSLVKRTIKENSSLILSVGAGAGVITTAYLTGKASFKAANVIDWNEGNAGTNPDPKERLKERTKLVWKLYIPPAIAATSTLVCIIGVNRLDARKTLAAQTALAVTQRAYSEYREKVIEEFGNRKDQSIRDAMAQDAVNRKPPGEGIVISGPGNVLCCELYTGRYFTSDMQALRTAQNDINDRLLKHDYATLDDLYYILGVAQTTTSGQLGWKSDKLMELIFSTVLTDDGRPCLAFEYNYIKPV
jgi:hypothetical protein